MIPTKIPLARPYFISNLKICISEVMLTVEISQRAYPNSKEEIDKMRTIIKNDLKLLYY